MNDIENIESQLDTVDAPTCVSYLNQLSRLYALKVSCEKGIAYGKRALEMARHIADREAEADALRNIGIGFGLSSQYKTALEYYYASLSIAREIEYIDGIASCYNNIAINYSYLGDNTRALQTYENALDLFERTSDTSGIAIVCINMGELYKDLGDYENAFNHELRALRLSAEVQDESLVLEAHIVIGDIYMGWMNYDKAREHYEKALGLLAETGIIEKRPYTLNQLGTIYTIQGSYIKALEYVENALLLSEEFGKREDLALSLHNIGRVYINLSEPERARGNFDQALAIYREIDDKEGIQRVLRSIGESLHTQQRNQESIEFVKEAVTIGQETGLRRESMESLLVLSSIYQDLGDFKQALEYHREYAAIRDSIFREQSHKIAEIQTRHENEQMVRESEIYRLKNVELAEANRRLRESYQKLEKAQEEIIALERTSSALAMAVTANHEINQPLMIIQGNLELLSMELSRTELTDRQKTYFSRILDSIERIHNILDQFKSSDSISFASYSQGTEMAVLSRTEDEE